MLGTSTGTSAGTGSPTPSSLRSSPHRVDISLPPIFLLVIKHNNAVALLLPSSGGVGGRLTIIRSIIDKKIKYSKNNIRHYLLVLKANSNSSIQGRSGCASSATSHCNKIQCSLLNVTNRPCSSRLINN